MFGIVVVIWEGAREENGANGGGSLRRVSTYEGDVLGDGGDLAGTGRDQGAVGTRGAQ